VTAYQKQSGGYKCLVGRRVFRHSLRGSKQRAADFIAASARTRGEMREALAGKTHEMSELAPNARR